MCTKRYHGVHKYQQVSFFSNVKSVRLTYGNKEELVALKPRIESKTNYLFVCFSYVQGHNYLSVGLRYPLI